MGEASIADLEAELGCLEPGLPETPPRRGHGNLDTFFDVPAGTCSRLEPPSKTKSVYPFGNDGTLGWTTPAGELFSIASSVDDRLVGIEYKQSIGKGKSYYQRSKMLERAINASYGSGYGIGISLQVKIHPSDVSWTYNRWPRYTYQHDGLEIRLQYYIESQSVIQQYQIRNNGHNDASLPYVITSDVCFREHGRPDELVQPVPSAKSPQRLLLIQNSEVLIRNPELQAQAEMALFLNGERQSLWAKERLSESRKDPVDRDDRENITAEIKEAENTIRNTINAGRLLSEMDDFHYMSLYDRDYDRTLEQNQSLANEQDNFATYRNKITIPGGSTQELSAIIQISGFTGDKSTSMETASSGNENPNRNLSSIWQRRDQLARNAANYSLDRSDPKNKPRILELIEEHMALGEAFSKIGYIGLAKYHFYVAYSIAEYCCKNHQGTWNNVRFRYAEFLDGNGWHRNALNIVERLADDLSGKAPKGGDIMDSGIVGIDRIASVFLRNEKYDKVEKLYNQGLDRYRENSTQLNTNFAHCLERVALTQVYRKDNESALEIYMRLMDQQSPPHHRILSNLGFIERRLGLFSKAKVHYERSLAESRNVTDAVLARSGLSICLRELKIDPEERADVWPSFIHYIDVSAVLSLSPSLPPSLPPFPNVPFSECFSFAIARQLECLLSVCSIPLKDGQSSRGIAFTDNDPLNCVYDGRAAYFQFRFLIQCQMYYKSMQEDEDAKQHLQDRIRSICEGHLVWAFQTADSTRTWYKYYAINGSRPAEALEASSDNLTITYSVQGAFQFLKLCLYLRLWNEKWQFVVKLFHLKLRDWLFYLRENRHMANLWIEHQDYESFKPYNSISDDVVYIERTYPHYHLSDAALIWLALFHIEKTIRLVENNLTTQTPQDKESIEPMVNDIRQCFDECQDILSLQQIQSNVLKIFGVRAAELSAPLSGSERAGIGHTVHNSDIANSSLTQSSNTSALRSSLASNEDSLVRSSTAKKQDLQVILLQRTIKRFTFDIEGADSATIEASMLGMFEGPNNRVEAAWRETLKMQKEKDISAFEDPRQVALIMFATKLGYNLASSRVRKIEDASENRLQVALYDSGFFADKIVDNAPQPLRNWEASTYETMSLLIGGFFEECRDLFVSHGRQEHARSLPNALDIIMTRSRSQTRIPISVPGAVNPFSRMNQTTVIETDFLPDWMYRYPEFIHRKKLEPNVRERLEQLSSVKSLGDAIGRHEHSDGFNRERWKAPFEPAVVDSGVKRVGSNQTLAEREISVCQYWDRDEFFEQMCQPRDPKKAKKRLIELSSQHKESILVCWLTISEEESVFFLPFIRRHESSESFFGERAHWEGNVWETEFHLGFYELLSSENDSEGGDKRQSVYKPGYGQRTSPKGHKIKPVALSFRFVGDLRDRYWTCHFFSSANNGFEGFVEEYYRPWFSKEDFYEEKQCQRKVLELAYVEKALSEMGRSIGQILNAFEKDLDAPEAKNPATESLDMIHNNLSPYLELGRKLRNVSKQFDTSLRTIEQWEKREEAREFRSRWSYKDEERHGEKIRDLTRKYRLSFQQLRVQQGRLREQQGIADQAHSNLVSYKQLQQARMSTEQAADVRLFTYVTIIFLPLSFSSSLFSMAGAPSGSTIYVMVSTTAVALTVTFLVLANLRSMDRRWSFWVQRMHSKTREQMRQSNQSQKWKRISKELELTTRRRHINSDFEQPLPAESNWWYFRFWLSIMRTNTIKGLRAWESQDKLSVGRPHTFLAGIFLSMCALMILIIYAILMMLIDTIHLVWIMARKLGKKKLDPKLIDQDGEENVKSTAELSEPNQPSHLRTAVTRLITWLESSPRPIRDYIGKIDSTSTDSSRKSSVLDEIVATLDDEATGSQRGYSNENVSRRVSE